MILRDFFYFFAKIENTDCNITKLWINFKIEYHIVILKNNYTLLCDTIVSIA